MLRILFRAVLAVFASSICSFEIAQAAGVPAAAMNKTIRISFGVTGTMIRTGQAERGYSAIVSHVIYVSGTGRLFIRNLTTAAGKKGGGRGLQTQSAPDQQAGNRRFTLTGTTLTGQIPYASGARLIAATFDPNFTACSVTVRDGRENGANYRRRGPNGSVDLVLSSTISSPSCSIEQGNAFSG